MVDAPQVVLLFETSKSVLGDVIVITPGNPVKFDPVTLNVCDVEDVETSTLPKLVTDPATTVGPEGPPVQVTAADALFLGAGAPTVKSKRLLFVSAQPLLLRIAAVVALNTGTAAVSKSAEVPYPTKSITEPAG